MKQPTHGGQLLQVASQPMGEDAHPGEGVNAAVEQVDWVERLHERRRHLLVRKHSLEKCSASRDDS